MLTPADDVHHINKHNFKVPFVCGCRDLGEALRRIAEGTAMIRTKVTFLGYYRRCKVVQSRMCFLLSMTLHFPSTPQIHVQLVLVT